MEIQLIGLNGFIGFIELIGLIELIELLAGLEARRLWCWEAKSRRL